jgi:hypothetical protein
MAYIEPWKATAVVATIGMIAYNSELLLLIVTLN